MLKYEIEMTLKWDEGRKMIIDRPLFFSVSQSKLSLVKLETRCKLLEQSLFRN